MNMKAVISNEITKRQERMRDAVAKGSFEILSRQRYRSQGKTITVWEVWSNHTHRRKPRLYVVSRVQEGNVLHWGCTCPDFETNGQWFPCKHILYLEGKNER